jgi:hypothetical protein
MNYHTISTEPITMPRQKGFGDEDYTSVGLARFISASGLHQICILMDACMMCVLLQSSSASNLYRPTGTLLKNRVS